MWASSDRDEIQVRLHLEAAHLETRPERGCAVEGQRADRLRPGFTGSSYHAIEERIRRGHVIRRDASKVDPVVFDDIERQAANTSRLVHRQKARQPPRGAGALDFMPRRCGVPLQRPDPALALALVYWRQMRLLARSAGREG